MIPSLQVVRGDADALYELDQVRHAHASTSLLSNHDGKIRVLTRSCCPIHTVCTGDAAHCEQGMRACAVRKRGGGGAGRRVLQARRAGQKGQCRGAEAATAAVHQAGRGPRDRRADGRDLRGVPQYQCQLEVEHKRGLVRRFRDQCELGWGTRTGVELSSLEGACQ